MRTVVIVGVGLIGGSFALALRKAGFAGTIIGVSSENTIAEAVRTGVVDRGAPLQDACAEADLVYLAQPISIILKTLPRLRPWLRKGALVTDAGSTKRRIVECAAQSLPADAFLGGHPMAGKETRGVGAADAELFRGRPYILTPARHEQIAAGLGAELTGWLGRAGALVRTMTPEEHDRTVAASSHLPQLLSTALASMHQQSVDAGRIVGAAGPGLYDMTRLALSSYDIWRDILATNGDSIDDLLGVLQTRLAALRSEIASGHAAASFEQGAEFAKRLRRGQGE